MKRRLIAALAVGAILFLLVAFGRSEPADQAESTDPPESTPQQEPAAQEGSRLVRASSPYLREHADNAVDWYPWAEEAFARAREEDRPVFVSIGYSSCHWCHVMEEESFMDPEVGALLNDYFVPVLVDREERPDIDSIYITAANLIGGRTGWPLNVIMNAEGEPFYTATYIPRESRPNQVGMLDLLPFMADAWQTRREDITSTAAQVRSVLERIQAVSPGDSLPGNRSVEDAADALKSTYDELHPGFGEAPKFPQASTLLFLRRYADRTGDDEALGMVRDVLRTMRHGGVYDQVGFGFHRYASDREWLIPHFEKMLYDQALMALVYTEAFEATGDPLFRETAEEILTYVDRDLAAPGGAYYASEDADSEGEEGTFYLWDYAALVSAIGKDGELIAEMLGTAPSGNFVDEATGERRPVNVLHLPGGIDEFAAARGIRPAEMHAKWNAARSRLLAARAERGRPSRDEKILADWNGLMIAAFARAGRVLENPRYIRKAAAAFDFVLRELTGQDGRLVHSYFEGTPGAHGQLDDYAFLLWGALELYDATYQTDVLATAVDLAQTMGDEFRDEENGGFFLTGSGPETLLVRQKVSVDTDLPSGNSVAMLALSRLARLTARTEFEEWARETGRAFGTVVEQVPEAHTLMLAAVDFMVNPSFEVVIVGERDARDTQEMLGRLRSIYFPGMVVLLKEPSSDRLSEIAEFTRYQVMLNGAATAYVCEDFTCNLPTNDAEVMISLLTAGQPRGGLD